MMREAISEAESRPDDEGGKLPEAITSNQRGGEQTTIMLGPLKSELVHRSTKLVEVDFARVVRLMRGDIEVRGHSDEGFNERLIEAKEAIRRTSKLRKMSTKRCCPFLDRAPTSSATNSAVRARRRLGSFGSCSTPGPSPVSSPLPSAVPSSSLLSGRALNHLDLASTLLVLAPDDEARNQRSSEVIRSHLCSSSSTVN